MINIQLLRVVFKYSNTCKSLKTLNLTVWHLRNDDDVQDAYHNAEFPEEFHDFKETRKITVIDKDDKFSDIEIPK